MAARTKLNKAYANGALLVAACLGAISQSWGVFAIALVVLLAGCFYTGDIRGQRPKR